MGLIPDPSVDPNDAGSSGGVQAGASQSGGCLVPTVVPEPRVPPPNVIAHHRQPPEEALDGMEEDLAPPRSEVIDVSLGGF